MIYLKQLSGDYITIETTKALSCKEVLSQLVHPCAILFQDSILGSDTMILDESEVFVLFQEYHTYFIWQGGKNMMWPGETDQTYCIDCSTMKRVEWSPNLLTSADTLVADLLSFGLYHPYQEQIKNMIGVDRVPIDMDLSLLYEILVSWKEKSLGDTRKLTLVEFLSEYDENGGGLKKYYVLFRCDENQRFTPEQWINRITI